MRKTEMDRSQPWLDDVASELVTDAVAVACAATSANLAAYAQSFNSNEADSDELIFIISSPLDLMKCKLLLRRFAVARYFRNSTPISLAG
jgi:hypothetical protein